MGTDFEERLDRTVAWFRLTFEFLKPPLGEMTGGQLAMLSRERIQTALPAELNMDALCMQFRLRLGKSNWYNDVLPKILGRLGCVATFEDGQAFAKRVQKEVAMKGRSILGEKEVIAGFLADFPFLKKGQLETLDKVQLNQLIPTRVAHRAAGHKRHWFFAAVARFGMKTGDTRWYENILPCLMLAAGLVERFGEARKFAERVKTDGHGAKKPTKGVEVQKKILNAFIGAFPFLKGKKIDQLASDELSRLTYGNACVDAADRKLVGGYPWNAAAAMLFRQESGERGRWFEEVLPNLLVLAGAADTYGEAKRFVEEKVRAGINKAHLQMQRKVLLLPTIKKSEPLKQAILLPRGHLPIKR